MVRNRRAALLAFALGLPALAAGRVAPRLARASARSQLSPAADLVAELESALDKGSLDEAIRKGEKALEIDPRNSMAHDLLGRAWGLKAQESLFFEQMHLARRARAFFEKAVALDPGNVSARADLATYDMRAPAFLGGGREKARRQAEEVLRLDAARGHELLGHLAESEKDAATAEAQFRRAVEASPAGGELRARRALSGFLVRKKRFEPARQIWLEVLEREPADPAARYEIAGVALACGEDLERAARDLEASLAEASSSSDPSRGQLHERLAEVEARLGRSERARAELEEALRLEPHRAEWRRSLARMPR